MKKNLPYILIIILVLVGLFSPMIRADAQFGTGVCWKDGTTNAQATKDNCENIFVGGTWQENGQPVPPPPNGPPLPNSSTGQCWKDGVADPSVTAQYCTSIGGSWQSSDDPNPPAPPNGPPVTPPTTPAPTDPTKNGLLENIEKCSFSFSSAFSTKNFDGCVERLFYFLFASIPGFLLTVIAKFFDAIVNISLSSTLFASSTFVASGWAVVRDLSNIFFIIILLWIAIRIILDLHAAEAKKMIVKVIITALLINFSMFFTQVIIDTSNVLALIFYNKIDVTDKDGKPVNSLPTTKGEKGISAAMASAFNPSQLLNDKFFNEAKEYTNAVPLTAAEIAGATAVSPIYVAYKLWGYYHPELKVPIEIILGIIVISGIIMCFAAYAFLWAGLSFLSRLIELWVLIIFSPFAFMSSAIPELKTVPYLGWEAWFKRLIQTAFMAPIFMFFMYLIFMLIHADLFAINKISDQEKLGTVGTIVVMIISAVVILILLLKATEFAKKGSGKFGEVAMAGAKAVGGLALGAVTGGTALALTSTVGAQAKRVASDENLKAEASGSKEHFAKLGITDVGEQKRRQVAAQQKLAAANKTAGRSFDIRDTGVGKFVAKKTGLDLNAGTGVIGLSTEKLKGGAKGQEEREQEEHQKKEKSYQMSGGAAMKHDAIANDPKQPQNVRAAKYVEHLTAAKEQAKKSGKIFGQKAEERFKKLYENGGDQATIKKYYEVDIKTTEGGTVENIKDSKQINAERRIAYANSLDNEAKAGDSKNIRTSKAMSRFYDNFRAELGKKMTGTAIGGTLVAGALTGGVGAGVVAGGLFLHAFKEAIAKTKENISTTAGLVAAVRKGEDPDKKWFNELKKLQQTGHGDTKAVVHGIQNLAGGGEAKTETAAPEKPSGGTTH